MESIKSFQFKVFLACMVFLAAAAYFISPDWMARAGLSMERSIADLDVKSVTVAGDQYFYLEGGSGPDMVLVHGFGGSKDNYIRFARHLTKHYHLIIPDLTGFGESAKNLTVSYDVFSQTARLHEFIRSLGLNAFHLVGHSMGGAIAGAYGTQHPERVKSLLLMAPAGVSAAPESELFRMLDQGINPFMISKPSDFDVLLDLTFFDQPFIPRPVRLFYAKQLAANKDVLQKTVTDLKAIPFSLEEQVRRYPGPVLVIWGDRDRILLPEGGVLLGQAVPGLVLKIMKNCGHMPMMERPKEAAGYYLSFLEGLK